MKLGGARAMRSQKRDAGGKRSRAREAGGGRRKAREAGGAGRGRREEREARGARDGWGAGDQDERWSGGIQKWRREDAWGARGGARGSGRREQREAGRARDVWGAGGQGRADGAKGSQNWRREEAGGARSGGARKGGEPEVEHEEAGDTSSRTSGSQGRSGQGEKPASSISMGAPGDTEVTWLQGNPGSGPSCHPFDNWTVAY